MSFRRTVRLSGLVVLSLSLVWEEVKTGSTYLVCAGLDVWGAEGRRKKSEESGGVGGTEMEGVGGRFA